jgi:hypothetical protein
MFLEQQIYLLQEARFDCQAAGLSPDCTPAQVCLKPDPSSFVIPQETLTVKFGYYCQH